MILLGVRGHCASPLAAAMELARRHGQNQWHRAVVGDHRYRSRNGQPIEAHTRPAGTKSV